VRRNIDYKSPFALIPHRKRKTHFPHSDTTLLHRRAYSRQAQVRASCFCFQARALTLCRTLDNREEFCRVARILLVLFMKSKEIKTFPPSSHFLPKKRKLPKTKTHATPRVDWLTYTPSDSEMRVLAKDAGKNQQLNAVNSNAIITNGCFHSLLYSNSR